jgi:hypothetical protein
MHGCPTRGPRLLSIAVRTKHAVVKALKGAASECRNDLTSMPHFILPGQPLSTPLRGENENGTGLWRRVARKDRRDSRAVDRKTEDCAGCDDV